jgi:hypothetical protein
MLTDKQLRCKPDCPECKGTGSIGGDTDSMWACTRWTMRLRRYNRLDPYLHAQVDGTPRQSVEEEFRRALELEYGDQPA